MGFEKGLSHRLREAPVFVGIITSMILVATIVAVIPGIPVISFLIGVQVINGLLLPVNLFFIWRLSRNHELMGQYRNRGMRDLITAVTLVFTSTLSLTLVAVTVLGV